MQGRVAFLPCLPVTLKSLRRKETDFEPQTVGEHIKKRRLELGMTQKAVARTLKVSQFSVINWERGDFQPSNVVTLHRIVKYLDFDPLPAGEAIPDRLRAKRREMGWRQRELADYLGVDRCSVTNWELGGTILKRSHRVLVARFLGVAEAELLGEMAERWFRNHEKR